MSKRKVVISIEGKIRLPIRLPIYSKDYRVITANFWRNASGKNIIVRLIDKNFSGSIYYFTPEQFRAFQIIARRKGFKYAFDKSYYQGQLF
jgi:hypothetical protein